MVRGTTAQFKFNLPYPQNELRWVTIKFWQSNNPSDYLPITVKFASDELVNSDSKELYVSLRGDETAKFSDKYKAKVQLRAQHSESGTVFGSRPQLFTVYPMLDEILEEDPLMPAENAEGWVVLDGEMIGEE